MFTIEIAGLRIGINNKYSWVERSCKEYIVQAEPQFSVCVSQQEIDREMEISSHLYSRAYCESVCIYREICKQLPQYNAFLLHAAVVEYNGEAYAFVAPSGTGKSTHAALWCKYFEGNARIINGDKPIVRFLEDGRAWIYGTPWCGKEGYNINTSAPLKAICFIQRGTNNYIEPFSGSEMVGRLMKQILMPQDVENIIRTTNLLDRCVGSVPCYLLTCNMDVSAAKVAYEGMQIKRGNFS